MAVTRGAHVVDQEQSVKRKRKIRWSNWAAYAIGLAFWIFVCQLFVKTVAALFSS